MKFFNSIQLSLVLFLFASFGSIVHAQSVRLNEVMSSNASFIADEDGDFQDWIELYNDGATIVNLSGYGLSDNADQPFKWIFQDVSMEPGEYLLVWASGKNRTSPGNPLHTNFSISAAGENILISHPEGELVDEIQPIEIPTDLSYGRQPDATGSWYFFNNPTPGSTNMASTGYTDILGTPVFSHTGGFYDAPFTLNISSDPETIVLYTLDGSDPDEENLNGKTYTYKNEYAKDPGDPMGELLEGSYQTFQYTESLEVTDRTNDPNKLTDRSSTYDQSPWYAPSYPVFKGTVVRARAVRAGHLPSEIVTKTYFVTPEAEARYTIPVFSISLQENLLFGFEEGVYTAGKDFDDWRIANPGTNSLGGGPANYHRSGDEFEYSGHVELFDPQSATVLDQRMGLRIHGGWSRSFPSKSLRLYARNEYGKSHFEHSLFPDQHFNEYKRILLRNSGNDWETSLFRDAAIQQVAHPLRIDKQAYRPAVIFLNAEYWGLLNIRERYDKHYLNRRHGVNAENVDILEYRWNVVEGDANHYNAVINYIETNGLEEQENYEYIKTQIDVDNFIDYQVIQIFADNTDWPGNNIKFWRLRTSQYLPNAPYGHDGRWRWMLYDTDFGFGLWNSYTNNTLAFAAEPNGPDWPNPPWSTFLFRELLKNDEFKTAFINRFDDMLNSAFLPERTTAIINEMRQVYEPEIAEHLARWKTHPDVSTWSNTVDEMIDFAQQRPVYQREHIRNFFGLESDITLTVNVSDPQHGYVRLNTIEIKSSTIGIEENPYPLSRTYFHGIPMELEAIPTPGYRFAGWHGFPNGNHEKIQFTPYEDISLTAFFEPAESIQLLHYWNFNNTDELLEPSYTIGEAKISITENTNTEILDGSGNGFSGENVRLNDITGTHLRVNNPLGSSILLEIPTTDYRAIVVKYETRRSGQGSGTQIIEYSTDGVTFLEFETIPVIDGNPALYTFTFAGIEEVDNNPDFVLRISFEQGEGGVAGNNRFDNLTIEGMPLESDNVPPIVGLPIGLIPLIESGPVSEVDLNTVFLDVDQDPLTFTVTNIDSDFVETVLEEGTLVLTPLRRGDAIITIHADDGRAAPVSHQFRVLVYPEGIVLNDADFIFDRWDSDLPERIYPEHMIFLQSDINDPGINAPLLYPYYIAHDDYHADDASTIGFPYNNTGRSRLNGLGEEGISFINTGRGRDLGGALVAINTLDLTGLEASWLCGTILQNSREYGINLQYRAGIDGAFTNIQDPGASYITGPNGHTQTVNTINLPDELLNQSYVQLLWRYYHISGTSGPRAELRLDDIVLARRKPVVSVDDNIKAEGRSLYPNPMDNQVAISFTMAQASRVKITMTDMMGRIQSVLTDRVISSGNFEQIFDTSVYARGSYIITIKTDKGTTHHKIIKN